MDFIQQGFKGKRAWYLYGIVTVLVFTAWQFIGMLPLLVTMYIMSDDTAMFSEALEKDFTVVGMDNNTYFILVIFSFFVALASLFIGVRKFHKKPAKTIITSRHDFDWMRFWYAFKVFGIVSVCIVGIGILLAPEHYIWNFKPGPFFSLLMISICFLPLQTGFEELLFRGYYMQGFAMLFKNKWAALLLTSLIFGLMHGANPEVAELGYITMVFYIGTGLFFGIVTLMDDGTELALGLHTINNIIAAIFVTTDWTVFKTDALFIDTSEPSILTEMFIVVFVVYPLLLVVFAKKFGWSNWKDKLFGKVVNPNIKLPV